jgi:hypothetical protein
MSAYWVETITEIRFPEEIQAKCEFSLTHWKYDHFWVDDDSTLPANWSELSNDDKYDFLNNNGYWDSGALDISAKQEKWLKKHDEVAGMHDEVVVKLDTRERE